MIGRRLRSRLLFAGRLDRGRRLFGTRSLDQPKRHAEVGKVAGTLCRDLLGQIPGMLGGCPAGLLAR